MILNSPFISGSLTITGNAIISGSITALQGIAGTASYASNAELLDGLDSTSFITTSSFNATSSLLAARIVSNEAKTGSFATTGSNQFNGSQIITGSLTATGTITAQTLVVQTVTSSVDFVTGSARFGSTIGNTHQFTGSMSVTGSLSVNGTSSIVGTGTTNYLAKFTSGIAVGNSNLINDASGNLGLGVTPSAWGGSAYGGTTRIIELGELGSSIGAGSGALIIGNNWYSTNIAAIYSRTGFAATQYAQNTSSGQHQWFVAPSGTAGNAISFTQAMTLNASGNLSVGNTNDTYKLDVSGTGRFTGALTGTSATFSGNVVLGTTALSGGGAAQWLTANGSPYGGGLISSVSGVIKAYYYYDNAANVAVVQGAVGVGVQLLANNVPALTIASTGAATFSTSVTAGGTIKQTSGVSTSGATAEFYNASSVGYGAYIQAGTSSNYSLLVTNYLGATAFQVLGSGAATFSSSVTAGGSGYFGSDVFTYNNGGIFFSGFGSYSSGIFQNGTGLNLQISGSSVLKLAYTTGAATFSSSVTAATLSLASTSTMLNATYSGASNGNGLYINQQYTGGSNLNSFALISVVNKGSNPYINLNNGTSDIFTIAQTGAATFSSSVTSKGLSVVGASGGYTTSDNPYINLGGATTADTFGAINHPFGDKMKFNAYHGFEFKTSNNGASATPVSILTIASTGAATFSSSVTATSYITSSDRRLKNIINQQGDLATYTLKNSEQIHYGYIAQDMEASYPNQVYKNEEGYLSLNYIEILVKKVYDLEQQIEQLKVK